MTSSNFNGQQKAKQAVKAQRKWRAEYRAQRFVRRFGLSAILAQTSSTENRLDPLLRKLADQA